ncbi:MAG TPA: hypothetical protein PKK26_05580 [Candidatus Wallbacteria bacterium]|nr:hypothetical protein [Candidatus Wallbacteria bacterium]
MIAAAFFRPDHELQNVFLYILYLTCDGVNKELLNLFVSRGLDLKQRLEYARNGETAFNYAALAILAGKKKLGEHLQALVRA